MHGRLRYGREPGGGRTRCHGAGPPCRAGGRRTPGRSGRWGVDVTVVPTPVGDADVRLDVPDGAPGALLLLGHGAGGGVDAPDLVAVTEAAVASGLAVVRVTQPYRVAGRRTPPRAPVLDEAWLAVV